MGGAPARGLGLGGAWLLFCPELGRCEGGIQIPHMPGAHSALWEAKREVWGRSGAPGSVRGGAALGTCVLRVLRPSGWGLWVDGEDDGLLSGGDGGGGAEDGRRVLLSRGWRRGRGQEHGLPSSEGEREACVWESECPLAGDPGACAPSKVAEGSSC